MAIYREGVGIAGASGVLGNLSLSRTKHGPTMRTRPEMPRRRSPKQIVVGERLKRVNVAWDALSPEDVLEWKRLAEERAVRDPSSGRLSVPAAVSIFTALSTKRLQVDDRAPLPTRPPEGPFFPDAVPLVLEPAPLALRLVPLATGRAGMLTEVAAQRVRGPHNEPKARGYVTMGFFAFAAGTPVLVPVDLPGTWVVVARCVEASSGRMTEPVPLGRVTVPAGT